MRRAAKVDANQGEIVRVLRECGATVRSTAAVGSGFVDIVVGYQGRNYLLEIKDGAKVPSARMLTPAEQEFHEGWKGQAAVVESPEQALRVIGAI